MLDIDLSSPLIHDVNVPRIISGRDNGQRLGVSLSLDLRYTIRRADDGVVFGNVAICLIWEGGNIVGGVVWVF